MGQANLFHRNRHERYQPAIDRYQNEGRRLLAVLDRRLRESTWLAGPEYTIADIANWCWAQWHSRCGVSIEGLSALEHWMQAIAERPAVQRGLKVPGDARCQVTPQACRNPLEQRRAEKEA
jgi:GSH-dependent disulfide-bond oxidoreductase